MDDQVANHQNHSDQDTTSVPLDTAIKMGQLGCRIIPIPTGEKYPKGFGRWQERATDDEDQILSWWGTGEHGIGWAMGIQPNGTNLVAIDVDVVDKPGAKSWGQFITETEMLAETRSTISSRTGSGGAHFIFQLPPDVRVPNGVLLDGVDVRGQGGFIVIPPTIHPNGQPYEWGEGKAPWDIPPVLAPEPLLTRLTTAVRMAKDRPTGSGGRITTTGPNGPTSLDDNPEAWVRQHLAIADLLEADGWTPVRQSGTETFYARPDKNPRDGHSAVLHDEAPFVIWSTSAPAPYWRAGLDNPDGSKSLSPLGVYAAVHHQGDISAAMRHLRKNWMPPPEVSTATPITTEATQPAGAASREPTSSHILPDDFWVSSNLFSHIQDAAHSRLVSPDALLISVLARFAALVPPTILIPATVGTPATLDFIGAVVAQSAGGKSISNGVAAELLPPARKDILFDAPVGSGEGLVAAFMGWERDGDGKRIGDGPSYLHGEHRAIHFTVDEGTALMEQNARRGTTIVQTLCSAWSGAALGQLNASAETRRLIPAKSRRVSAVINMQTINAHQLMEHEGIGLPQRIVFGWAHGEFHPDIPWPGRLELPIPATTPTILSIDPTIETEIRERRIAVMDGSIILDPLDGHQHLLQTKIAALFALMHGSVRITPEYWNQALTLIETSRSVRSKIQAQYQARQTQERHRKARLAADFDSVKDQEQELRAIQSLVDTLVRHVKNAGSGGIARGKLRKAATKASTRHRFDRALGEALDRGQIREKEGRLYDTV